MLSIDLELQSNLHFAQHVAARGDISRHGGIAPKVDGERKMGITPAAVTEPPRPEEVIVHAAAGRLAFVMRGRHRLACDRPLETGAERHVVQRSMGYQRTANHVP